MAKNLNYNVSGRKCYGEGVSGVSTDSIAKNCATYGRLYDWATAMNIDARYNSEWWDYDEINAKHQGICPKGWHIPRDEDWDALMEAVGGASTAGTKLKANSDLWISNGRSTDNYGFSALPGGLGYFGGSFTSVGNDGVWFSASEYNSSSAYNRSMYYRSEDVFYNDVDKSYLCSVRCVKD